MSDQSGTIEVTRAPLRGPEDAAPYLVVVRGAQPGLQREVTERFLTLGRDAACSLPLGDKQVSKLHCRLWLHHGRVVLEDMGSTNGTFVDGTRVSGRVRVKPEALVQLGEHVLRLEFRSREEIARAEAVTDELHDARAYVEALLPARLEDGPVRTSWCYLPSAILGGDVFGYHALDAERTALYLLDVCGHGTAAAMHSASAVNVLRNRTLDADFGRPGEVLARLNDSFQMEHHAGMYFTLWYGVYHAGERHLAYASAGHPPALLVSASGAARRLQTPNPPIGALAGKRYAQAAADVEHGERLYLFSDGVYEIEEPGGRAWGLDDFERLVRAGPAPDECERLRRAVQAAAQREAFADDFSLLVATFP